LIGEALLVIPYAVIAVGIVVALIATVLGRL
jgi:biopolymer transport protein ExbB/TolQ